ncbi:glucose 1-dehydrogenase [Marinigracilibium pacificum]|uniref:Glucose 1-dehydrogenase n=1 Tax=Marinigracilibium pacificum TaxID=2729599 RepID=A0A848J5Z5_9BACT|nr:glucose 1-dehydrogenase [Marinigracilibium pacificum]NMM49940.1 glucose 1-dehydrogenase [Marinigracilibium pacificum]
MKDNNTFNLTDKVAIVTGASKGIGLAIAQILAMNGAKVVISSRKQEAVDEVADELKKQGFEAIGIAAHMGDMQQIDQLVEKTREVYGGIDIVVNNAAINPAYGPIKDVDSMIFDKIMDVNVKGPFELARKAYDSMKSRGGGSVINISSIEGITPGPGLGLYSVSKSALIALTKVMAREWGRANVRCNVICPGLVKTKFSAALLEDKKTFDHVMAKQALPKVAEPEDIAGLALFLASEASSFCTGGVYVADGGYVI